MTWDMGYHEPLIIIFILDSSVLSRRLVVGTRIVNNYYCGALAGSGQQKFTEWISEDCYANHEFICQAPKGIKIQNIMCFGTLTNSDLQTVFH